MMRRAASAWLLVALVATMLASGGQPATASPACTGHAAVRSERIRCDASPPGARVRRHGWRVGRGHGHADRRIRAGGHRFGLPAGHLARRRADDRDRRRVRQPRRRGRPRRLPRDIRDCRPARPPTDASARSTSAAARPRRTAIPGWGVEIALDVQAVSASCPNCHILLVEADSPSFANIGKSVNTAVRLGADVVSNSYGGDEFNGIANLAAQLLHAPRGWRRSPRRVTSASDPRSSPPRGPR